MVNTEINLILIGKKLFTSDSTEENDLLLRHFYEAGFYSEYIFMKFGYYNYLDGKIYYWTASKDLIFSSAILYLAKIAFEETLLFFYCVINLYKDKRCDLIKKNTKKSK